MALQIFGTDFSMIEIAFGGLRSHTQIKNKWKKEERRNKEFIDELLLNKEGLTVKDYELKYGPIRIVNGPNSKSSLSEALEEEEEEDPAVDILSAEAAE